MEIQLLFPIYSKEDLLEKEIYKVRKSCDNVRKGMFKRHNKLADELNLLHSRLEILERNICKADLHDQHRISYGMDQR